MATAGTPPIRLIFSRSISISPSAASKRRWQTSFWPLTRAGSIRALQPVVWKKGIETSPAFWGAVGSGWGGASPRRTKARL